MTDLRYRSLAGEVWPAERLARSSRRESCWDIAVIPHEGDRLELRAIPFINPDTGAHGVCFWGTDGEEV